MSLSAQDMGVFFLQKKPTNETFESKKTIVPLSTGNYSVKSPATLLVIGDSLAQGFGAFLQKQVKDKQLDIRVINKGKVSTGLSRGDFYDWPLVFSEDMPLLMPNIVVAHFGANDKQAIVTRASQVRYSAKEWDSAYLQRTDDVLSVAERYGSFTYLLGPAPDRSENLNAHIKRVNIIFEAAADTTRTLYFPLSRFTAGPDKNWIRTVAQSGRSIEIRSGDGTHFTGLGYALVADKILRDIRKRFPSVDPSIRSSLQLRLQ